MSIWALIYTRVQWGALFLAGFGDRSANYPLREVWTHHTVMTQLSPNATVAQEMAEMRRIERVGQDRFGRGISYNFVIFPSGRIYMGLGASRIGAHTGGRNSISLSVAFAGNYEIHKPTAAALATYALLLRDFHKEGIIAAPRTNGGHRDAPGHSSNACAGRHLQAQLAGVNARAARPAASTPPAATSPAQAKPTAQASTKPWPAGRGPWPDAYLTNTGTRNQYQDKALFKLLGDAGYTGATLAIRLQKRLRDSGDYKGTITAQSQIGPQTIQAWQRFLKARGHYNGSITDQSQWGPQTTCATVAFLNSQAKLYWK